MKPVGVDNCGVGTDIERVSAAIERRKTFRDILRSSNFEDDDFEAKRAGRLPNLAHFQHCKAITDIPHKRQTAQIGARPRRKSSSRLPARSSPIVASPVVLPPGRAKLATKPVPTGSPAVANTIGITLVDCCNAMTAGVPDVTITFDLEPGKLGRDLGETLGAPLHPTIIDRDRLPVDPAELA